MPARPRLVKQTRPDKFILLAVTVTAAVLFFKSFSLCKGTILEEGRI